MSENQPKIGVNQGGPPSLYTRIPTRAIWDSRKAHDKKRGVLTHFELHVFSVLCGYANNQGFAYPNQETIAAAARCNKYSVNRVLKKCVRLGYLEQVSKWRQHPKWRHVMGCVWRIIYDDRLTQDDLIDDMNRENPAAIIEDDLPITENEKPEPGNGNQELERGGKELAAANVLAHYYCRAVNEYTGELRIVNELAILAALECQNKWQTPVIKERITTHLNQCRNDRRSAPPNLAWLVSS